MVTSIVMLLSVFFYLCASDVNVIQDDVECPGVEMVSREEWNARPPLTVENMTMPVEHIFIHHTAGPECFDLATCSQTMRGIQNFHIDDRGWEDIGYNFLIGGDGRVYVGRGWNRVGAHTYGFNRISVAFSLMGNYVHQPPSDLMLNVTKKMIKCAQDRDYVTSDFKLHGHRDGGCTECPGEAFYNVIQNWPNFQGGPLPGSRCWRP